MTSLLTYKDQGFWVSNSINAMLYDILVAMTRGDYPEIQHRLDTDELLTLARFGGGFGFCFDDFERIFGDTQKFEKIVREKWSVIEEVCQHDQCTKIMRRVFYWAFRLMNGGKCNYELAPYAAWRLRFKELVYAFSLGMIDLAPERTEHPTIYELSDEPHGGASL